MLDGTTAADAAIEFEKSMRRHLGARHNGLAANESGACRRYPVGDYLSGQRRFSASEDVGYYASTADPYSTRLRSPHRQ
jgi:hypothetical protein